MLHGILNLYACWHTLEQQSSAFVLSHCKKSRAFMYVLRRGSESQGNLPIKLLHDKIHLILVVTGYNQPKRSKNLFQQVGIV